MAASSAPAAAPLPTALAAARRAYCALPIRASLEHNGLPFALYASLRTLVRPGAGAVATICIVVHPHSRFVVATEALTSNPLPRGAPTVAFAEVLAAYFTGVTRPSSGEALGFRPSELLVDCPALADAFEAALVGSRTIVRVVKAARSNIFTGPEDSGDGAPPPEAGVERFFDALRVAEFGGPQLQPLDAVADEVARAFFSRLPLGYAAANSVEVTSACANTEGCGRLMFLRAMRLCGRCLSRVFCGPACQAADWPAHKRSCRSARGAASIAFAEAEAEDAAAEGAKRGTECDVALMPESGSGQPSFFEQMLSSPEARTELQLSGIDATELLEGTRAFVSATSASDKEKFQEKVFLDIRAASVPLRELRRIGLARSLIAGPAAALAASRRELAEAIARDKAARSDVNDVLVCIGRAQDARGPGVRKY